MSVRKRVVLLTRPGSARERTEAGIIAARIHSKPNQPVSASSGNAIGTRSARALGWVCPTPPRTINSSTRAARLYHGTGC